MQGRIQDFYNGVSISKKLQEYIWDNGISSDQLLTIIYRPICRSWRSMYLCVQCAKHSQHAYSRGSGDMPPGEIFL